MPHLKETFSRNGWSKEHRFSVFSSQNIGSSKVSIVDRSLGRPSDSCTTLLLAPIRSQIASKPKGMVDRFVWPPESSLA